MQQNLPTRILSLLVVGAMLVVFAPPAAAVNDFCGDTATDSGDTWQSATPLADRTSCSGHLQNGSDENDWYRIEAGPFPGQSITVEVCNSWVEETGDYISFELRFKAAASLPSASPTHVSNEPSIGADGCATLSGTREDSSLGTWYVNLETEGRSSDGIVAYHVDIDVAELHNDFVQIPSHGPGSTAT